VDIIGATFDKNFSQSCVPKTEQRIYGDLWQFRCPSPDPIMIGTFFV
jgi:hypothetical protein